MGSLRHGHRYVDVLAVLMLDSTPRPRLIVSYAKGMTKIYTLVNVLGEWMVEAKPPTFTNESLAGPLGTFVLDPTSGNELNPTAEALSSAMSHHSTPDNKNAPPHCIWIAASKKSIRAAVNFNGERIAKVEFEEEELGEAFYITRHGKSKILAGLTIRSKDPSRDHDNRISLGLLFTFPAANHQDGTLLW